MYVEDFDGQVSITSDADLDYRLRSVRRDRYGVFTLWHVEDGPSLWLSINGDFAYLHFFPGGAHRHPGFQPTGMTPADCPDSVHFLQKGGDEASSFDLPSATIISVETAYCAAREYLHSDTLPESVSWFEL